MANIDLEDVLLHSHAIEIVQGPECDWDAVLTCSCGWDGGPHDYGAHLLVVLGLEDRVLADWKREMARGPWIKLPAGVYATAPSTAVETHPLQDREYLNLFRGPKDRVPLTKEERREYNNLWRSDS